MQIASSEYDNNQKSLGANQHSEIVPLLRAPYEDETNTYIKSFSLEES
jgi:hypothetical protein